MKTDSWLENDISNLVNLHASSWKSENLHFDGLLLSKTYKVLDEKVEKSYVSWHWRVIQSFKKNWPLFRKMARGIWWMLMRAVASLKICTLMCFSCWKYIMFESKNYRGVMCRNTGEWCKIWRGAELCFKKYDEEFGEFWPNTRKSQNLYFNGILLNKVCHVWVKKVQRSYASLYWRSMQTLK